MGDSLATVTEAISRLQAEGFDSDFTVKGNRVECGCCKELVSAPELTIHEIHRFEGQSDPGDEMIVVAVTCNRCGQRGVIVTGYGTATSPEEAELLLALRDGR